MINQARVKRGMYVDSITLMQVARSLNALEGVEEAAALMATPANLQLLAEAGLAPFVGITDEPGGKQSQRHTASSCPVRWSRPRACIHRRTLR